MTDDKAMAATPHAELIAELMNPNNPKNEREHAAVREIERLRAAQGEPVAYLCENAVGHKYFRWKKPSSTYKPIALYTSPPAQRPWQGLTDDEVQVIWKDVIGWLTSKPN
jgi:hypothetical protein